MTNTAALSAEACECSQLPSWHRAGDMAALVCVQLLHNSHFVNVALIGGAIFWDLLTRRQWLGLEDKADDALCSRGWFLKIWPLWLSVVSARGDCKRGRQYCNAWCVANYWFYKWPYGNEARCAEQALTGCLRLCFRCCFTSPLSTGLVTHTLPPVSFRLLHKSLTTYSWHENRIL